MNAPDKIYVSRNFSEDNSPHGLWYLNKSEHDINVEYIRKEALLGWCEKFKKSPLPGKTITTYLIEYLESL